MVLAVGYAMISCSSDADEPYNQVEDENVNPANLAYAGTKWSIYDSNISIGDDYVGTQRWTMQVYFYSNTEGVIYMSDHSNYSDVGLSSSQRATYFKYEVNDKDEYIWLFR